jgi:hypothetical protein
VPQNFFQPWAEIDPEQTHGGLPGALEDFVGPRLGDNPTTKNIDMLTLFGAVRDTAASISMAPTANAEGPPGRPLVEEILLGLNLCIERILDRTRVASSGYFEWRHATPPCDTFALRPIRYPLRNEFARRAIFFFLGTLVEVAENSANARHSGLDPSQARDLLGGLLTLKASIAKDWFDKEVEGEITLEELNQMFAGVERPGPTIVPPGQSQPSPSDEVVTEALAGISLIQWFPNESDWQIFGKKHTEQYKPEPIWQPEGAVGTTEDVAPENPTPATGPPIAAG